MLVEQIITNQMQPLVWPSLHADLGRLVVTDECFLAYCYEEGWEGGCWDEYPGSIWDCCYGGHGGFVGFTVGSLIVWLLALATTLHARRWGASVMNETECCLLGGGGRARTRPTARLMETPLLPRQASMDQADAVRSTVAQV